MALRGRDDELRAIGVALAAAQGGAGAVVVVEGPIGIGKTAFLGAAHAAGRACGYRDLSARGGELERDYAFGVVRQLLGVHVAGLAAAERDRVLSGAARLAAPAFADLPPQGGPMADTVYATLHGLYWLTANLAETMPVLLTVDDVHWVDGPSLRFLAFLARRLEGLPVVLLLTGRSGDPGMELDPVVSITQEWSARVIRLSPLSRPDVAAIVQDRLPGRAGDTLVDTCHRVTGGNPLYLSELLTDLAARTDEVDDTALVAAAETLVPERAGRAVMRRVERLAAPAAAVAAALAVLPEGAGTETVGELTGGAAVDVERAVRDLVSAAILAPGHPIRFIHPIVRSAVLGAMGPTDERTLHRRAAEVLHAAGATAEVVAAHLLVIPPAGQPWAVETLRAGAAAAMARGAPDVAVRQLRRALAEPGVGELRPQLTLELGVALARAGDPAAIDSLSEVFEATEELHLLAGSGFELAELLMLSNRAEDTWATVDRATAKLMRLDPAAIGPFEALVATFAQVTVSLRPRVRDRLAAFRQNVAEGMWPRFAYVNAAYETLGDRTSTADDTARLAEAGWDNGNLLLEVPADSAVTKVPAVVFLVANRWTGAADVVERGLTDAAVRGSARSFVISSLFRSVLRLWTGDLRGAEADARAFAELVPQLHIHLIEPFAAAVLIPVLLDTDRQAGAMAAASAVSPSTIDPSTVLTTMFFESRGLLLLETGRPAEALGHLLACSRFEEAWGDRIVWLSWGAHAARAASLLGRRAEAKVFATEQLAVAARYGAPRQLGIALRGLALSGADDPVNVLEEADKVLRDSGSPVEHARVLADLGAAIRRAGDRRRADETLREALALAHRHGAETIALRAVTELGELGVRPRRLATTGPDSLTPAERRIAILAAEGRSNKEIGQALFVTEKTVESHLRGAFRKLGITSRVQLKSALEH